VEIKTKQQKGMVMTMTRTTMTKQRQRQGQQNNNDYKTMTTTTTNRMIAVQMWGGELLRNIVWQGCDDPTHDRICDCIRATLYCGRTIKHAT
jgi:hypothetical protein